MSDAPGIRHEFVRANGLRFHVATCGEGDRLALCLHGFPECWFSWRHQLPFLAQLGYRAWAPDLRGYGDSDRPLLREDYTIERLLDDVAGLIDAAGARSTMLLAHDWGAVIAWCFAMRRVRPLERLVIMNVPHPGVMDQVIRSWRQLARSWYVLFFQIPRLPEALLRARQCRAIGDAFRNMAIDQRRFGDEVLHVYRDQAARPGALTAMLNYYRAYVRGGGAARQRALGYPIIDVPTLMIWGEHDTALGKETTYGTDRFVRQLTLHYLPNVSHWVQQEAPEAVNALIQSWLGKPPDLLAAPVDRAQPAP
ncbi:MAG TPA: alpha/beta hydrolase [Candidatus Binatia bacterium]|nr:alpha/beta hydrolase [Candidatus Binatia bacterium]